MPWQDRIKPAAYTSPSGTRVAFTYEDVSRETTKRTSAFNFPDVDGTEIQDLGRQGRRFPVRAIFWGDDHDLEATAYEDALLEKGTGKLEHPFYGTFDVVPFGNITRRDPLTTAGNQSIVECTFWEVSGIILPSPQADPTSTVLNAVSEAAQAAAEQFADNLQVEGITEQVTSTNRFLAVLDQVRSILAPIAAASEEIEKQFNAVYDSINEGIDVLIGEPLTLALQAIELVQLPGRSAAAISDRLGGYADVITGLTGSTDSTGSATPTPGTQAAREANNDFEISSLFTSSASTSSVLATVFTEYEKKPDAVASGDTVVTQSDTVTQWQDEQREALEIVDTGTSYQQRIEAVYVGAGFLVEISFALKPERVAFIKRARTIIDLCSEVYATTTDEDLDRLINNNNLTGSQILELQVGDEVVYYV